MSSRVVIVAHGHPKFGSGGGEIAAHRHFEYMRAQNCDVDFVGSVHVDNGDRYFGIGQHLVKIEARDFIMRNVPMDPYLLDFADIAYESRFLDALLAFDADVYHFHHIWNIGARTIYRLMKAKPQAKFVLTLHEFLMICASHGQMLKNGSNELCFQADPYACAACLPQHGPSSFYLRRNRLLRLIERFDLIISPSHFLRSRYEAWGVTPGLIKVVENGMPAFAEDGPVDERDAALQKRTQCFAYFGQGTPTKGVNVLVAAAKELERRQVTNVRIDVHGVTADQFQTLYGDIEVPKTMVRFLGRYRAQDVVLKMRRYGWIVVPSIWWENSPLVIQEAKLAEVPVIASNIGGMKEKIADWGVLFQVGDFYSLADILQEHAGNVTQFKLLRDNIDRPAGVDTYHRLWTYLVDGIDKNIRAQTGGMAEPRQGLAFEQPAV